MPWARIDDAWWSHPKTIETSLAARGLWATALSWAGQQRTDHIPRRFLMIAGATEDVAQELVEVGFWIETDRGWRIHDWSEYQEKSLSEKRAEAGRKGGLKSAEVRRAKEENETKQTVPPGEATPKADEATDEPKQAPTSGNVEATVKQPPSNVRSGSPDPSRPDPSVGAAREDQTDAPPAPPPPRTWDAAWTRITAYVRRYGPHDPDRPAVDQVLDQRTRDVLEQVGGITAVRRANDPAKIKLDFRDTWKAVAQEAARG